MSLDFPSTEWAAAYQVAINANAGYKTAGKDWTHGVVAFVVKADPAIGIDHDMGLWLDVHGGECRSAKLVSAEEANGASFVIVAPYARWKEVIRREVDPTKAMMQGKLKVVKGNMPTLVKFVNASKELVASTSTIDTKFRGE